MLAGVTQLIDVLDETVTPVAGMPANFTVAPAANALPVMVTDVPPAIGPELGVTDVMAGISGGGLV